MRAHLRIDALGQGDLLKITAPGLPPQSPGRPNDGQVLLYRYFVRKQEGRGAIGELNQKHRTVQIADLT